MYKSPDLVIQIRSISAKTPKDIASVAHLLIVAVEPVDPVVLAIHHNPGQALDVASIVAVALRWAALVLVEDLKDEVIHLQLITRCCLDCFRFRREVVPVLVLEVLPDWLPFGPVASFDITREGDERNIVTLGVSFHEAYVHQSEKHVNKGFLAIAFTSTPRVVWLAGCLALAGEVQV